MQRMRVFELEFYNIDTYGTNRECRSGIATKHCPIKSAERQGDLEDEKLTVMIIFNRL